jgi:hypothetical protein
MVCNEQAPISTGIQEERGGMARCVVVPQSGAVQEAAQHGIAAPLARVAPGWTLDTHRAEKGEHRAAVDLLPTAWGVSAAATVTGRPVPVVRGACVWACIAPKK